MSDWLPRLLPALLAVTATLLAQGLCSTLLPSHGRAARTLLWLLFGSLAWAACTQVVLFDHLLAKVAGQAVAGTWAAVAALSGGSQYASEVLQGQTAGRLVASFSHARPALYYLWVLPVILLP